MSTLLQIGDSAIRTCPAADGKGEYYQVMVGDRVVSDYHPTFASAKTVLVQRTFRDFLEAVRLAPHELTNVLAGQHLTHQQQSVGAIFRACNGLPEAVGSYVDGRNEACISWLRDNPLPSFPLI